MARRQRSITCDEGRDCTAFKTPSSIIHQVHPKMTILLFTHLHVDPNTIHLQNTIEDFFFFFSLIHK